MGAGRLATLAIAMLGLAGCLESDTTRCGDRTCPAFLVCASGDRCVTPEAITACNGIATGESCTLGGTAQALCYDGVCVELRCGNGVVDPGEVCDDSNTQGGDGCSGDCTSNETCGNGVRDLSEGCDCGTGTGTLPPGCSGPNSNAQGSTCRTDCQLPGCGDGVIEGLEECEGTNVGAVTCDDVGFYGGTIGCTSGCRFDTSACVGRCGDGIVNGTNVETCDGSNLNGQTCASFGYYGGTLSCNPRCGFDTTACTGRCGDGIRNGSEPCDGTDLGGSDCTDLGFYNQPGLACTSLCSFNTTSCTGRCGDGVINGQETCDGIELGGATCATFDFYNSSGLACTPACGYTTAGCTGFCGDGILNGGEDCDDANTSATNDDVFAGTCADIGFYDATTPGCTARCSYDDSTCTGFCGDRLVNGSEPCDGKRLAEGCAAYGYERGTLSCSASCAPDFGACDSAKWISIAGSTVSGNVFSTSVWGAAPDDVFMVGTQGSILRWNGTTWSTMNSGTTAALTAVWGADENDVFAVGGGGTILHWDGGSWSAMTSGTTEDLKGVWGAGGSNVVAVGFSGTILRWNGSAWSPMSSGTSGNLHAVWGTSASDVFAAGANVILHWNGITWSPLSTPQPSFEINAIWGSESADVFFAGGGGLILHWNGSTVSAQSSGTFTYLWGLWGLGPSEVYATGAAGTILRWDGTTWTALSSGTTFQLRGVWGSSATNIFVVGDFGTVRRWQGKQFMSNTSNTPWEVTGMFGTGPTDVFASTRGLNELVHWDGNAWKKQTTPGQPHILYGGWSNHSSDAFVVGSAGTILRYNGFSWSAMASPATSDLHAVWGSSSSDVFAVGNNSWIVHFNGSTWSQMTPFTSESFYGVWGSSPTNVVAVGIFGTIQRYNGTSWSTDAIGVGSMFAVWGSGPSDIFAVGNNGRIVHYDGVSWSLMASGTSVDLSTVFGTGPHDVYAGGVAGTLLHFDGISWAPADANTGGAILAGFASYGTAYIGGDAGTIRRWDRTCAATESCADRVDNDCDGAIDCSDLECASSSACLAGGLCAGYTTIACGSQTNGTTVTGVSRIDTYSCDEWLELGRETVYRVQRPTNGQMTVTLSGLTSDLDLVVLRASPGGSCDPGAMGCVGSSSTSGPELVFVDAKAGQPYYIVVDGHGGDSGTFTLDVACP